MGNNSLESQEYDIIKNYHKTDWIILQSTHKGELWRNKHTNEIASVFKLYQYPSIEDLRRFQCRSVEQELVKVLHIALEDNFGICVSQPYVHLLIEYIPITLEMTHNLDFEEGLTVLSSVLKGFNFMQTNFGPIEPSHQLIGFNQWGKAKVWLNKQHNMNYPPVQIGGNVRKSTQSQRVRKLFSIIQNSMTNSSFPYNFKKQFMNRNMGYSQSISFIQQFAFINELSLKRYMRMDLALRRSEVNAQSNIFRPSIHNMSVKTSSNFTHSIHNMSVNNSSNFAQHSRDNSIINKQSYTNIIREPQLMKRISSHGTLLKQSQPIMRHDNNQSLLNVKRESYIIQNPPSSNNNPLNNSQSAIIIPRISFNSSIRPVQYVSSQFSNKLHQRQTYSPIMNNYNHKVNFVKKPIFYVNQQPQKINLQTPIIQPKQILQNPSITQQKRQLNIWQTFNPNIQPKKDDQQLQQQLQIMIKSDENLTNKQQIIESQQYFIQSNNQLRQDVLIHTANSIINKLNINDYQNIINNKSEYQSSQEIINQHINQHQYIQTSGTFHPINQHENQIIGMQVNNKKQQRNQDENQQQEGQDYYEQDKYYNDSQIIQEFHHKNENQENLLSNDNRKQLPINFQSFAPNDIKDKAIFVSFAPLNNINQNIEYNQNIHGVQTSKSLQYADKLSKQNELYTYKNIHEPLQQQIKRYDQYKIATIVTESNHEDEPYETHGFIQNSSNKTQIICQQSYKYQRRDSFANETTSIRQFYQNYTPIQSKLDIIKKNSNKSRQNQRISAFDHCQDSKIENYIRNKYNIVNKNEEQPKDKLSDINYVQRVKIHSVYSLIQEQPYQNISQIDENIKNKIHSQKITKNKPIKISNISEKTQQDFLDVNFLQKSLDSKYNSKLKQQPTKVQQKQDDDDDILNIAKLQEGLIKFSNSKASIKKSQKGNTQRSISSQTNLISSFKQDKLSSSIKPETNFKSNSIRQTNKNEMDGSIKINHDINAQNSNEKKLNKQNIQQYKSSKDDFSNFQHSTGLQYNNKKGKKKSVYIDTNPSLQFKYQLSYTDSNGFGNIKKQRIIENDFSFRKNTYQNSSISTPKHVYQDNNISKNNYLERNDYSSTISPVRRTLKPKYKLQGDRIDQKYRKYVQNDRKRKYRPDNNRNNDKKSQIYRHLSRKESIKYVHDEQYRNDRFNYEVSGNSMNRVEYGMNSNQSSMYRLQNMKVNVSPIKSKIKDSGVHISYENLRSFLLG